MPTYTSSKAVRVGGPEVRHLGPAQVHRQLAQVPLATTAAKPSPRDGAQVVALAFQVELAGDLAAEVLPAADGHGVAGQVGLGQLHVGLEPRGGVEAHGHPAEDPAAEHLPLDVVEPGPVLVDDQRRAQLGDLLPLEPDARQVDEPAHGQVLAVGRAREVADLPLEVFQRHAGLDRVAAEDDDAVLPVATGRHAGPARPVDRQVAAEHQRPAVVEPLGELGHHRRHQLAQLGVEPQLRHQQVPHRQVERAGVFLEDDGAALATDRRLAEHARHVAHGDGAVVEDERAGDVAPSSGRRISRPGLGRPSGPGRIGVRTSRTRVSAGSGTTVRW